MHTHWVCMAIKMICIVISEKKSSSSKKTSVNVRFECICNNPIKMNEIVEMFEFICLTNLTLADFSWSKIANDWIYWRRCWLFRIPCELNSKTKNTLVRIASNGCFRIEEKQRNKIEVDGIKRINELATPISFGRNTFCLAINSEIDTTASTKKKCDKVLIKNVCARARALAWTMAISTSLFQNDNSDCIYSLPNVNNANKNYFSGHVPSLFKYFSFLFSAFVLINAHFQFKWFLWKKKESNWNAT